MDSPDAVVPPLPAHPSPRIHSRRPRQAGSSVPVSPFAPLAHALVLGGAAAAVFLAGGLSQGVLGIFLLCAGTAMVICPPRVRVEWRLWAAAAGVLAGASLALLPEHALPEPAWRHTLDTTPPIVMPGTISTAPALTVFWLVMLTVTLLAGLFLLSQPIRSRWLLGFALTATLVAGVYGAMAIYAQETGWHYPYSGGASFGFFLNRNHTATFLLVGCLLALGVLAVVLREGRWLAGSLAAGALAVCAAGLAFYSPSRAGIIFLLVGIVLWLAGLGRHRDSRVVVSFAALLLASGLLFVVSGGEVRDRLLGRTTPAPAAVPAVPAQGTRPEVVSGELRLAIYHDAWDAIRDFPLTGTGLGTFSFVFPQYRQASRSEAVAMHPESDWVLFAFEAGIPATLCLLALLLMAAGRLRVEREHPYWPLRWGCAVAAAAAALHGMVDAPIHTQPLGWWALAVAGLALQSGRAGAPERSRVQHALFVIGGLVALAQGGWLARAEWFGGPPSTLYVYGTEHAELFRLVRSDDPARALRLAQQTAREHPMEEMSFRALGDTLCMFDHTEAQVDAAFRAERLVEPILTATPLAQGVTWLDIDPAHAATYWSDALERCVRNYQAAGLSQQGTPVEFFGRLMYLAAAQPAAQTALWKEVGRGPEYAFAWVENATPPEAAEGIARLAADETFLHGLDAAGQHRFLRDWYRRGPADALTGFLDGRTDWQEAAWPVRLARLADTGQPEKAVREGAGHYGIALTLPEPGSGGAANAPTAQQESDDPAAAFMAYWSTGNDRSARRVLDEAVGRAPASQRAELQRLKTALAAHDADWPDAWRSLEQEIAMLRPDDAL